MRHRWQSPRPLLLPRHMTGLLEKVTGRSFSLFLVTMTRSDENRHPLLRAALPEVPTPPSRVPVSLRAMLAGHSERLGPELSSRLSDHLVVRNRVAHTSESVNGKLAADLVNDVNTAIAKLKASGLTLN
jgi:hypothetical protein